MGTRIHRVTPRFGTMEQLNDPHGGDTSRGQYARYCQLQRKYKSSMLTCAGISKLAGLFAVREYAPKLHENITMMCVHHGNIYSGQPILHHSLVATVLMHCSRGRTQTRLAGQFPGQLHSSLRIADVFRHAGNGEQGSRLRCDSTGGRCREGEIPRRIYDDQRRPMCHLASARNWTQSGTADGAV